MDEAPQRVLDAQKNYYDSKNTVFDFLCGLYAQEPTTSTPLSTVWSDWKRWLSDHGIVDGDYEKTSTSHELGVSINALKWPGVKYMQSRSIVEGLVRK